MPKEKPFKTEVELCACFLSGVKDDWASYAETAGWDILLVRKADGFQIGIQAKLRLGVDVINQTIEDGRTYRACNAGPDCRAILVPPNEGHGFGRIAGYIGFTIIQVHPNSYYGAVFTPQLPRHGHGWESSEWFECCPAKRHELPDYVPDVAAGASAPTQLTTWKIAAMKIAITVESRGYVTREDFKHHGIDYRRWIANGADWLRVADGRYTAGNHMPDFKGQHPRNYAEIAADQEKWMRLDV